jgi:hypothetical protein
MLGSVFEADASRKAPDEVSYLTLLELFVSLVPFKVAVTCQQRLRRRDYRNQCEWRRECHKLHLERRVYDYLLCLATTPRGT